ncbi:hypothetical protein K440DRAFT_639728 [Wilcoxina mikolae CBS 423.85]|nr:hypothetical protein K440DRAFT_639728 [Wilcoxina mikolae CBS 423.85]
MGLIRPQQSSYHALVIRQTEDAKNSLICVNTFRGEWLVCAGGFKGCCERPSCSWCKENGSINLASEPLVSTSKATPTTTLTTTATIREPIAYATPATTTITPPIASGRSSAAPKSGTSVTPPSEILSNAVMPTAVTVVILFAVIIGFLVHHQRRRKRRRAQPTIETPITSPLASPVSQPRTSSFFQGLKKRLSVALGLSPPPPAYVEQENQHSPLPGAQELQGDTQQHFELSAVERRVR